MYTTQKISGQLLKELEYTMMKLHLSPIRYIISYLSHYSDWACSSSKFSVKVHVQDLGLRADLDRTLIITVILHDLPHYICSPQFQYQFRKHPFLEKLNPSLFQYWPQKHLFLNKYKLFLFHHRLQKHPFPNKHNLFPSQ